MLCFNVLEDTIFGQKVVVAVPQEVLVCMGGFAMHRSCKCIIWSHGNKSFQEGKRTIVLWVSHGKLNVRVNGINVLEELITMFSLLDDKGVIHIRKPKPGWIRVSADGFGFKLFHKQVGN